ncbi:response regulator, partial [Acidobacteria bacterium AH-259-A15]|nr:response regulator [Acidobacteria bacterium AH-259-A15]
MVQTANVLQTTIGYPRPDHILVVDDEPLIRDSLSEYLNDEGFLCETARTGREALEKLQSQSFALVITDIRMPELNGFQLLENLSRMYPDVAVIMLTGQDDVETAVKSMQQGACDYITKPLRLEPILERVKKALHRRSSILEDMKIVQNLETLVRRKCGALHMTWPREVMSNTAQRRLAAIMFTDIVGYSVLAQEDEMLALELLGEHQRLLRPIFAKHGGREVKTMGDSFLVEFASVFEAVRCAISIQKTLAEHNAPIPTERRIQIRIGLHVGDVILQDNDVFGNGVNIASRIESLAHPGGICVSEDVARQVRGKIEELMVPICKNQL